MKQITKTLTQTLTGLGALLCLSTSRVLASALSVQEGANAARAEGMPTELIGDNGVFSRLTNTILLVVGLISVIMLVYGGLRYILSGGDSKKVTDAKTPSSMPSSALSSPFSHLLLLTSFSILLLASQTTNLY